MHAEHVHLVHAPPLVDVELPLGRRVDPDAGIRDEQVDRPARLRRDPARDVFTARDVADEREPADLARDRLDLLRRPPGDRDAHPRLGELPRDRGADPAAAARDQRDALQAVRRHVRSPPAPPGSRASRGRPDPRRARAPAPRAARSSRSASSAAAGTNRTRSGLNAFPSSSVTARATPSASCSPPGRGTQKSHSDLALDLVRDADRGRLRHRRVTHRRGLDLRRPDPLARDVERVVRAPVQEPVAVLVHRGPVAVRPDAREAPPVRLEVALGVAPDPARHARPRALADELADLAAHGPALVVEDVHVLPERREAERARLRGRHERDGEEARAHLRPARDVHDRDAAGAAHVLVEPVVRAAVPRLAGRRDRAQRGEVRRGLARAGRARARASARRPSIVTRSDSTAPPDPVGRAGPERPRGRPRSPRARPRRRPSTGP